MHCSPQRLLISCTMLAFIFILPLFLIKTENPKISEVSKIIDVPKTVEGPFVALEDNKTFIISLYYDPRQTNLVRIIALVHKTTANVYCLFHCKQNGYLQVKATIDVLRENFGFVYATANILCPSPPECDYAYMSLHTNNITDMSKIPTFKIQKDPVQSFTAKFTVCISAIFKHYNNALQMIQAIEMYKLLGASRVTIYNTSCHENVDRILRHYIQEGVVEVLPWPIDKYMRTSGLWKYVEGLKSDIGYYGQSATLNDCLYRNMYKSEFVLLNDIDEFILPMKYPDWPSLIESLQKRYPQTSVFRFENHIFPSLINATEPSRWSHVPGYDIFQHLDEEPPTALTMKARKMIINPRKVIQTTIHSVLKAEGDITNVSGEDGILYHCKPKRNMKIPEKDLIRNDLLSRFGVSLVPNVDKIVQELFPQN